MNGYNFTERVRKCLALARSESARLRHEYVGTEHILLGMLAEGQGVAATVLQNLGVDSGDLAWGLEQVVKKGDLGKTTGPDLPYTSRAKKVLELAMSQARSLNHSYVGTEHLLLGLIAEKKGIAAQVLIDHGVTLDKASAETIRVLSANTPRSEMSAKPRSIQFEVGMATNRYNFTERVRKVLALAREESEKLHHEYIGTEHILLGMIAEGDGVGATALQNLNVDLEDLRFGIEQMVKRGNPRSVGAPELPYTSRAKKVIELAMSQARKLNHTNVGTEHLLLGLIAEQDGIAARILSDWAVTLDTATAEVLRILGTLPPREERPAEGQAERVEFAQVKSFAPDYKSSGGRVQPPTEILVELIRAAEVVATEHFSSEATPVHAAIALLRRGEGFAIAIIDRLGCDREKALRALEEIGRNAEQNAAAEQSAKLGHHLADFLREMYQPWKLPLGTLDLLLFAMDRDADVAAVFAEQGITRDRVLEEGQRFSG